MTACVPLAATGAGTTGKMAPPSQVVLAAVQQAPDASAPPPQQVAIQHCMCVCVFSMNSLSASIVNVQIVCNVFGKLQRNIVIPPGGR